MQGTTQSSAGGRIVLGFVAGFVATLVFHQAMVALLGATGMIQANLYSMRPVPPFGVPTILSQSFWGGVWGILFAFVFANRGRGAAYYVLGFVFGAIALPLVGWFVVAPLKGQPLGNGWVPMRMLAGVLINGAWGLGCAVFLRLLERMRPTTHARA